MPAAAPFKRNDAPLKTLPIGVLHGLSMDPLICRDSAHVAVAFTGSLAVN
jgi:hypothetical protein